MVTNPDALLRVSSARTVCNVATTSDSFSPTAQGIAVTCKICRLTPMTARGNRAYSRKNFLVGGADGVGQYFRSNLQLWARLVVSDRLLCRFPHSCQDDHRSAEAVGCAGTFLRWVGAGVTGHLGPPKIPRSKSGA